MKNTRTSIQKTMETLIDQLNLGILKTKLLNELRFNYCLNAVEIEDYAQLGNSRFGGSPDLPKEVEYPQNEEGDYDFLCQINFADFPDRLEKLPTKGILYVFCKEDDTEDYQVIFSKSTDNLMKKNPPSGKINSNWRGEPYDGLKISFEMAHYFSGNAIDEVYDISEEKYDALIATGAKFNSHILANGIDGEGYAYKYLHGFETLGYISLHQNFEASRDSLLRDIEKNWGQPNYDNTALLKMKEQILRFDQEKEKHLKNGDKVTCLISLQSLSRLGWCWNDAGDLQLFVLDEDLEKENFENVLLYISSS